MRIVSVGGRIMRQSRWTLLIAALAAVPFVAQGKQPEGTVALAGKPAAGYAGSATCTECHKKEVATFAATFKGKLFLQHPRDEREAEGCESCHGPAKQHVQTG